MNFGQKIRNERKKMGWSQVELAKRSGLSQGSISFIENSINSPSEENMRAIASALGTTVSALLDESSAPAPRAAISDEDIKFALFGGDQEITDEQFAEVKRYALYLKERAANDRAKPR